MRKFEKDVAELKRMYVQPASQKHGAGSMLLDAALKFAKHAGYSMIRLDTLNDMYPAISLYKKFGFYEIPAYYYNPEKNAVYFERELK